MNRMTDTQDWITFIVNYLNDMKEYAVWDTPKITAKRDEITKLIHEIRTAQYDLTIQHNKITRELTENN